MSEWLDVLLKSKKLTIDEYKVAGGLPSSILENICGQSEEVSVRLSLLKKVIGSEDFTRKEYCWPDGVFQHNVVANDVSQLNPTSVAAIYQVRCIEDIQKILRNANGRKISIRGTKHSMGGQSIAQHGIIIDMEYINHTQYNKETNTVTVGTGATWAHLIKHLNRYGKSPRTLQSYCSFSIGGTLSVNGHGITTDYTVSESVLSFRLIRPSGEIINCSKTSEDPTEKELFSLCLGGYGLFGIIFDVILKVDNNYLLCMENSTVSITQFPKIYESVLSNPDVVLKLARIDTTTFETIDLFVFTKDCETPTVSQLPIKPKEMGKVTGMIYKWIAAPLREVRFAVERKLGIALDWGNVTDRNDMLFESAAPLARLYSPLVMIDDTFVLQEYFIPKASFTFFMESAKNIIIDKINKETIITLLNITIRFVEEDKNTFLRYASHESGMFAFVLYYRLRRSKEADEMLENYHKILSELTLRENGSFYLPYRHHYTDEQLQRAYPRFEDFKSLKNKYDPQNQFGNLWWSRYGVQDHRTEYCSDALVIRSDDEEYQIPELKSLHRSDSFRKLVKDPELRRHFKESFLVDIFNLESPSSVWKLINSAIWRETSGTDADIYAALVESFNAQQTATSKVTGLWRLVKQISEQKKELVREIVSIVARTGQLGKIQNYCSIGDHGKLILPLQKALRMKGKSYIVHDTNINETSDEMASLIPAILERGEIKTSDVGEYIHLSYDHIRVSSLESIINNSIDMVTMNQGLHHLPPQNILPFLQLVHRILRPGGILIIREHDLDEDEKLLPMIDCAHMVFNALTGVSTSNERNEIRGFRSVLEWRKIVESVGFEDSMVYEMQENDPTLDIMLCFFKSPRLSHQEPLRTSTESIESLKQELYDVREEEKLKMKEDEKFASNNPELLKFLDHAPQFVLNVGIQLVSTLLENLPRFQEWIRPILINLLPDPLKGLKASINGTIDSYFEFVLMLLTRFQPLTAAAAPIPRSHDQDLIPNEFFLLVNAVRVLAAKGKDPLMSMAITLLDNAINYTKEMFSTDTPGLNIPIIPPSEKLTSKQVDTVFDELFTSMPELEDFETIISEMGLPDRIATLIISYTKDSATLKTWIVNHMDRHAWEQFCEGLQQIQREKTKPHVDLIHNEHSAWNRIAMAILGCPDVQLSGTNQFFLSSGLGLGKIVSLWKLSQQKRKERIGQATESISEASLDCLGKFSNVKNVVVPAYSDITGVLCVISAEYVVNSALGIFGKSATDVTDIVRDTLETDTGTLRLSRVEYPGSLLQGSQELKLVYRAIPEHLVGVGTSVSDFTKKLASEGIIDGSCRAKNGPFTWYKLPEWLQVEMVQLFGNSMCHTPWYRFPFMKLMQLYANVLQNEVEIVSEKFGKLPALLNSGFITDAVPMVVMGVLFAQMATLAYPLRKIAGEEYNEDSLVEQLILLAPSNINWDIFSKWTTRVYEVTPGVWVVCVKTFKAFTEFLLEFSDKCRCASVLEISNQSVIQMKVEVTSEEQLKKLEIFDGCKVKFSFQFPAIGNTDNSLPQVAVEVQIPCLLKAIRCCMENNIKVIQVYDFYG